MRFRASLSGGAAGPNRLLLRPQPRCLMYDWLVSHILVSVMPNPQGNQPPIPSRPRPGSRAAKAAARRDAILMAALDEFSAKGFASARLDDVAQRAGVAKGTIYLHFRDKEALFQELIRSTLVPLVGMLETVGEIDLPTRTIVERIVDVFVDEVFGTRRKDVIRLIVAEGPRFPQIAEFHYREVVSRAITALRGLMRRAIERGDLSGDTLVRFPQLVVAPALVAIIWSGLFDRFEPLDVRALMRAHLDLLFGAPS
jgi:AcrR family transcriptional regulator